MTVAIHAWSYCLDKWKCPQLGLNFKLTLVSSSRSNYLDLHLATGKGKRFFFYASLGYRISNIIQMSLEGLTIELKITTICSNWKYDHHFLWSSDLGMSRDHSLTVRKKTTGERWNHPDISYYQFVQHFSILHFRGSGSYRATWSSFNIIECYAGVLKIVRSVGMLIESCRGPFGDDENLSDCVDLGWNGSWPIHSKT